MSEQNRFFFRFRMNCCAVETLWKDDATALGPEHRLPLLSSLERQMPSRRDPGMDELFELRAGWHPDGLAFSLRVTGKKQSVWCRKTQPEESDSLHLLLDTRNVKDVHRATRFCHRLVFMPRRDSEENSSPEPVWLPIHRAKEHPSAITLSKIRLSSQFMDDGYRMDIMLPAGILTGYDPQEHPALGFHYVLKDRELGNHYCSVEPPLPFEQDPSLWATLYCEK